MAFMDLLAAICIMVNAVKGLSALQLSRDLDCQYKTAFVLAHKLREALAAEVANHELDGEVEIDGAYFGGHIRPANFAEDRIDRRLAEHQTGKRRVVVALRQRRGRTRTFVTMNEAEGVEIAAQVVSRKSVVFADEAGHWDRLHQAWIVDTKMYKWYGRYAMSNGTERNRDRMKTVRTYSATEARQQFSDLFDEAFYKGPVIVRKNSKRVAVVSMELLKELIDVEVGEDAQRAQEALREFLQQGGTTLADLKDELDL